MRFLHLSDLHATSSKEKDQQLLVDALLTDVARLHAEQPVDLVLFTGDLTHGGKDEEFRLAERVLLEPLLTRLGFDRTRLILTLGNHDVDRDRVDRISEKGLQEELACREAVNELLDDQTALARHTERIATARSFLQRWHEPDGAVDLTGLGQFHTRPVGDRIVGIAALNSAWRATGAAEDADKGRLLVGDRQSKQAAELAASADFTIALVHHPFDWLRKFDEDDVRRDVERHFRLVLTGHNHVADPEQVANRRGHTVYSRAGCLYEHRDYANGYSVVDVSDDGDITVSLRTYWPKRGEFDAATDVTSDGRIVFGKTAQSPLLPAKPAVVDAVPYNAVLGGLVELVHQTSVIADHLTQLAPRELGDLLVPPRLLPVPYELAIAVSDKRHIDAVDPIGALDTSRCLVVSGGPECGVTASLVWMLQKRYDVDNDRLPAYVRFEDVGHGRDPTTTAVRGALARFGHVFGPRDELPPLVIAVDDVHLADPKKIDRLLRHVAEHHDNLYILGCHGDADAKALLDRLGAQGVDAKPAFLGPFGRRELRGLVERIAVARHPDLADDILSLLLREKLPRTPFHMVVFVAVLSAEAIAPDAVNEATALEQYVKLILDRADPWDPSAHRLDIRNYEHILGSFAHHLTTQECTEVSRLTAERFLGDYFAALGWDGSPGQIIDALVRRRILVDRDGRVGFRHSALHDLFTAKHMLEDEQFAKVILDSPFENEATIRYAAALKRSDAELLRHVGSVTRRVLSRAREMVEVEAFERMGAHLTGWSDGLDLDDLKDFIAFRPVDEDERQHALDQVWDRMEASEAKRSTAPDVPEESAPAHIAPAELFIPAVDLLSTVLRHSELVDDLDLKRSLLLEALEGWAHVGVAFAAYEDKTGSTLELVRYFFEDVDPEEHQRFLLLFFVAWVADATVSTLGTSKIVGTLGWVLDDQDFMARTANALFATTLYCELRGPGWVERLESLYARHGDHPVVAQFVLVYARYEYLHSSVTQADASGLERIVVTAVLDEYKLSGQQAGRAKSQLLQDLRDGRRLALHRSKGLEGESYFARDLDAQEPGGDPE